MMRGKLILLLSFLLALVILSGCDNAPVELAGIRRVAVLTPENYTDNRELAPLIKREILAQFPRRLAIEVIDGAEIEAVLPPNAARSALSDPEVAAGLGRKFGVDAFVIGAATTYKEDKDANIDLDWSSYRGLNAELKVLIEVSVGFNLRLLKAADGSSVIYRQAAQTSTEVLVFGLTKPFVSFDLSIQPRYKALREQAVYEAVQELLRQIRREYKDG